MSRPGIFVCWHDYELIEVVDQEYKVILKPVMVVFQLSERQFLRF